MSIINFLKSETELIRTSHRNWKTAAFNDRKFLIPFSIAGFSYVIKPP